MMRIMIACEIANKSENMENQKHRVFWENIVFFQVPAISWVLGSFGIHKHTQLQNVLISHVHTWHGFDINRKST